MRARRSATKDSFTEWTAVDTHKLKRKKDPSLGPFLVSAFDAATSTTIRDLAAPVNRISHNGLEMPTYIDPVHSRSSCEQAGGNGTCLSSQRVGPNDQKLAAWVKSLATMPCRNDMAGVSNRYGHLA